MRFLLVGPPLFFSKRWRSSHTSHLLNLFSWVRRKNPDVDVTVLDLDREMGSMEQPRDLPRFRAAFRILLDRCKPDVVGISCWTSLHYVGSMEVARLTRAWRRDVPIVVGGYHATALPTDFAEPPGLVDYVVRGEGEVALSRILADGPEPAPGGPRIIDGAPLPLEEEELLFEQFPYSRPGTFELFLSRGCPFSCQFCAEPAIVDLRGGTWRSWSWEKTEALLRHLIEERGARSLIFYDALFGAKASFRHAVWELLASYDDPPTLWCETRVDLLDEVDYDFLARLPVQLDVGLDAITPESVVRMGKSRDPERYLAKFHRFVHAMAAQKRSVKAYLLVNYPGETLATLGATVHAVESTVMELCQRYGKSNLLVGAKHYQLFPGTPDYERLGYFEERFGARFPNDGWWRESAPRPEARAAAALPSRQLLLEGGLGGATSAIDYIWTVCRKHGLPAIHHHHGRDEIPPCRFRAGSFEQLLEGNEQRFHGLSLRHSRNATLEDGLPARRAYLYDAVLEYTAKLDTDTIAILRALLAAPTLGEGLRGLPGGWSPEQAFGVTMGLLNQAFLDLCLRIDGAKPARRVVFETTAGVFEADAAGEEEATLLGALIDSGYLNGLEAQEAWEGLLTAFPVPRSEPPLSTQQDGGDDPGTPGVFLGVGQGAAWPSLAIAARPRMLKESSIWVRLASVNGTIPAGVTVTTRIIRASRQGVGW